ncbi:pentatricopeptide repeat-containing protein At2g02750 [Argentina anserina]|uniref:pentatricopeptide repeat-containing protein At2g02750 n=1 Tax=Argentina anserina TaxID=57926 RepID=UPI0021769574|nr:pentatricopeptide repeat-containing protein At2g02750 [Potentilla anserina]
MKREIGRLVTNGLYTEALCFYTQRHSASLPPRKFTFPPLLKACAKLRSPTQTQMVHTHLLKTGFFADVYSATALIDSYMKLNLIDHALQVFDEMPHPNLASVNALISGFLRNGRCNEALGVFRRVGVGGLGLNSVSIASVFSACENVMQGMGMHCVAVKIGVESDVYVSTSAVSMYSRCGEVVYAAKVFEDMPVKNSVSYNAFVTGLLRNGVPRLVLDVFKRMRACRGENPNAVTFSSALAACASVLYLRFGRQVHGLIVKLEKGVDVMTGTALLDMYSKCGCWQLAYRVFEELNGTRSLFTWNAMIAGMMTNAQWGFALELFEKVESEGFKPDSVTWNSMISGFSQLGKGDEAFNYFKRMQSTGVAPCLKSVTSVVQVCADSSALQCGREVHGYAIRADISGDLFFSTALIDMYMKCGQPSCARRIFDSFHVKPDDPAFWNAMISGYGKNGENESAFLIFDQMLNEGVQPNTTTFISLLSMCSHSGLVDKGWQIFRMMDRDYGIKPDPKHYGCMIDLLGRSGRFDEARELTEELSEPSGSVFASLLGACECHLNLDLGKEMATKLSELEPENPTPFLILSKIYAGLGRWRDAENIRKMIDNQKSRKIPGLSLLRLHEK